MCKPEEVKKLRCKYCGEIISESYIKALDGNIAHPECAAKELNKKMDEELKATLRMIFRRGAIPRILQKDIRGEVEKALRGLGFHIWAHHQDEYLWGIHKEQDRRQNIFLWLDWINGEYHILEKTETGDIR